MKWFSECRTVAEAKTLYRTLAMQNHPDVGGVHATMQMINAQYHECLQHMDGQHTKDEQGEQHEYRYYYATEQAVMDKIGELLGLHMTGVEIRLIGTWVWVEGNTRVYKDAIKSHGMSWHSKRTAWYWRPTTGYRTHYNGSASLDDLEGYYGGRRFEASHETGMSRR